MVASFRTILDEGEATLVIEKSRFIGHAAPARDEAAAAAFIERIRKQHYDATHNVPVYIAGESTRFSDDGEPSGTAGAPIFDMLRHEGIRNVAIVVTRYFGGIKLGKGGLVRAYTASAKEVLRTIGLVTNAVYERCHISIPYHLHGRVEHMLRSADGVLLDRTEFTDRVRLELYVPPPVVGFVLEQITDASSGTAEVALLGEQFLSIRDGVVLGPYQI